MQDPDALVQERRVRLEQTIGRPLRIPKAADSPLTRERRDYLLGEARELYWNDLEWENVTGEEELDGGPLATLTFPGVLAYVRGLLLTEVQADALAAAEPRPQVVEDLMRFLAGRVIDLGDPASNDDTAPDEAERRELELDLTSALLDQVLMLYHGIPPEEVGPEPPGEAAPPRTG